MHGIPVVRWASATLFGAGLAVGSSAAFAADPPVPLDTSAPTTVAVELPTQWTAIDEREVSSLGAPVDVARLSKMRGGQDDHDSLIIIDGSVDHNSADRIVSGTNTISNGAFDNANGINTVIQNSGTNVLIQNAMVVNVHFVEPGP